MITIELPWPDKALSPNGRPHRMTKARMVKAARKTAWAVTLEALKGKKWADPSAHLRWSFHPKPIKCDTRTYLGHRFAAW